MNTNVAQKCLNWTELLSATVNEYISNIRFGWWLWSAKRVYVCAIRFSNDRKFNTRCEICVTFRYRNIDLYIISKSNYSFMQKGLAVFIEGANFVPHETELTTNVIIISYDWIIQYKLQLSQDKNGNQRILSTNEQKKPVFLCCWIIFYFFIFKSLRKTKYISFNHLGHWLISAQHWPGAGFGVEPSLHTTWAHSTARQSGAGIHGQQGCDTPPGVHWVGAHLTSLQSTQGQQGFVSGVSHSSHLRGLQRGFGHGIRSWLSCATISPTCGKYSKRKTMK